MKIVNLKSLPDKAKLLKRSQSSTTDITPKVINILSAVKKKGDAALQDYTKKFDGVEIKNIQISPSEIKNAYAQVSKEYITAVKQIITNLKKVAKNQLRKETTVTTTKGITVWREWRAIERIGLYVPGGKANYPSTVLMTAITAKVAGCKEIAIVSPPGKNGTLAPEVIVAADMAGITEIYKVGGAQAIAALAYGTETVRPVSKIFGPGNSFVTIAKQLIMQEVAIDMPAGPSEVFIIADETANPVFIAADLLADGEHGNDSACVLVSTSKEVIKETIAEIKKQLQDLPTAERAKGSIEAFGLFAYSETIDEAIAFCNEYAPEHLEIMTKNPKQVVRKIKNAGSVFLGDYTSKSSGDYATGANHVLPTGGMAKAYPPLGVDAFGKWMQVQECTKEGLAAIRKTVELFSEVEELPAHKISTTVRFST